MKKILRGEHIVSIKHRLIIAVILITTGSILYVFDYHFGDWETIIHSMGWLLGIIGVGVIVLTGTEYRKSKINLKY